MTGRGCGRFAGWTALLLLLAPAAATREEKLSLDRVPEAVRKALEQHANGAPIRSVERETEHGATVYEGAWSVDGVAHEAAVLEDGSLVELESRVAADATPPAIRAAIKQHFGEGAKVVIERKMVVVYELEGRSGGKHVEMNILATGRVLSDPAGADDDDDDDDDNEDDKGGKGGK